MYYTSGNSTTMSQRGKSEMPRHPDSEVEGHVVDAAYRLWRSKGERGLTMRAVAREAGTTTPTVYQRFRDKKEILEAMRLRAQWQLFAAVKTSRAIAPFCRRYLNFAASHKHEYELIHADWSARLNRDEPRPSFELLKRRLADRLGGEPEDHRRLALAIAALSHGTATQLLIPRVHESVARELRRTCVMAAESLVEAARNGRRAKKRRV
jgi:AcrR family transcriptional regulator